MSSVQVTITQLPAAGPITGTESVPIVQNGQTVQTTTAAIAASPSQTQTFLTLNQEPTLPNSRRLSGGTGIGLVDGGAQSTLQITLNGASGSLETALDGFMVKTAIDTLTPRIIQVTGDGIEITNGDGQAGNPSINLNGLPASLAGMAGSGLVTVLSGATLTPRSIEGTSNEIDVANGNAFAGNPTVGLADNAVLPGTGAVTIPKGTTAQEPSGVDGQLRYNTTEGGFYGFSAGSWRQFSLSGGVTLVNTGTGLTGGPITSTGTISIDDTVVATLSGSQTLTNKTISGSNNTLSNIGNSSLTNSSITIGSTSVSLGDTISSFVGVTLSGSTNTVTNIGNASLTNSSVTYNGVTVSLGSSGTITAASPNALTIGTGLSGSSYDGSTAVTIAIDSTVATLSGTQTLTNKSISGSANTLTNIANASLTNSAVTIGTTAISLGASSLTLGGLTSVAVTQNPTTDYQLATKQYVDNLVAVGTTYHTPVYVESPDTAGNLNATYSNGVAGVGATLTNAGTLAALTLDGVLMTVGKRVLIYNQTNQFENGVYTVTTVGDGSTAWVLTRATDADSFGAGADALDEGSTFFVQAGATGAGETYTCTTQGTITFGTTSITFAQIGATQVYSAGTGLTLTGTQFSLTNPVVASLGGTGLASYTAGDMLYYSTGTALSKLAIGTSTQIMTSSGAAPQWSSPSGITVGTATNIAGGAAGSLPYNSASGTTTFLGLGTTNYVLTAGASAPQYVAQSTLSVGSATNATNTAITADSTNANYYLTFVSTTTGNLPQLVNSAVTVNPSTAKLTGGIAGGAF